MRVQLRSFRAVKSPVLRDSIKLDTVAPTTWGPRVSVRQGVRIQKTAARVPTTVVMGAKDATSGLGSTTIRVECRGSVRATSTKTTASNALDVQIDRRGCTLVSRAEDRLDNSRMRKISPTVTIHRPQAQQHEGLVR